MGSQTAFDLDDQVVGQAQVMEGLVERVDVTLGLSLLVLLAFFSIEATTLDGFGLFFGVSSGWGHGGFLRSVCERYRRSKETMPHLGPEWPGFLWSQQAMCIND